MSAELLPSNRWQQKVTKLEKAEMNKILPFPQYICIRNRVQLPLLSQNKMWPWALSSHLVLDASRENVPSDMCHKRRLSSLCVCTVWAESSLITWGIYMAKFILTGLKQRDWLSGCMDMQAQLKFGTSPMSKGTFLTTRPCLSLANRETLFSTLKAICVWRIRSFEGGHGDLSS